MDPNQYFEQAYNLYRDFTTNNFLGYFVRNNLGGLALCSVIAWSAVRAGIDTRHPEKAIKRLGIEERIIG